MNKLVLLLAVGMALGDVAPGGCSCGSKRPHYQPPPPPPADAGPADAPRPPDPQPPG